MAYDDGQISTRIKLELFRFMNIKREKTKEHKHKEGTRDDHKTTKIREETKE